MKRGEQLLQALPVRRFGEVGYLITAFNSLLEKLLATQGDLTRMARRDIRTGLSNRLDLADQMRQVIGRAQRPLSRFAALYLDLDGFKPVNDVFGHQAGDAALTEVARRLSAIVRDVDVLARVGGDEFVILLGDCGCADGAHPSGRCNRRNQLHCRYSSTDRARR